MPRQKQVDALPSRAGRESRQAQSQSQAIRLVLSLSQRCEQHSAVHRFSVDLPCCVSCVSFIAFSAHQLGCAPSFIRQAASDQRHHILLLCPCAVCELRCWQSPSLHLQVPPVSHPCRAFLPQAAAMLCSLAALQPLTRGGGLAPPVLPPPTPLSDPLLPSASHWAAAHSACQLTRCTVSHPFPPSQLLQALAVSHPPCHPLPGHNARYRQAHRFISCL